MSPPTVTITSLSADRGSVGEGTGSGAGAQTWITDDTGSATLQPVPGKPATTPLTVASGTFDVGFR